MKSVRIIFTLIFVATALAACGQFQQDPLGSMPTPLKPPTGGPGSSKPGDEQVIRPNLASNYDFVMNVESKITLDGLVLTEKPYVLSATVTNMAEFPGATYDANTKVFTWTPKSDFFGGELKRNLSLNVHFVARPENGKGVVYVRDWVSETESVRQPYRPTLKSWGKLPSFVQEGKIEEIWFEVEDLDAGTTADTYPKLILNNSSKGNEIQPYLNIYGISKTSPTTFKFNASLDLTDVELTTSVKDFQLSFAPKSQYGEIGGEKVWSISVYTSLRKPISTWSQEVAFKANESRTWTFVITDPREEGSLKLESLLNVPAGANLKCDPSDNQHSLICDMQWTPSVDQVGQLFSMKMNVKSSIYLNLMANDSRTDEFLMQMKVIQ